MTTTGDTSRACRLLIIEKIAQIKNTWRFTLLIFQFNDMLLICSKVNLVVLAKYRVKNEFPLKDVWVSVVVFVFNLKSLTLINKIMHMCSSRCPPVSKMVLVGQCVRYSIPTKTFKSFDPYGRTDWRTKGDTSTYLTGEMLNVFTEMSLPPASAVEVIKTELSVCVCVCLLALSQLNRLAYERGILYRDWPW